LIFQQDEHEICRLMRAKNGVHPGDKNRIVDDENTGLVQMA